jgi:uncharacterized protein (TIGR02118 family)
MVTARPPREESELVRISVLYPSGEATTFDHDYYEQTHIPRVVELVGDALKRIEVDRGIAGGSPGTAAPYVCIAHLVFDSVDDFETHMGPHLPELSADQVNYTNVAPALQISEIAR